MRMMAIFKKKKKKKRGQIKPFSQLTSHFLIKSLEKPLFWQLFQAAWLLQVISLTAVTHGLKKKDSSVIWPEHSLRSDLRAPNLKLISGKHAPSPLLVNECLCMHSSPDGVPELYSCISYVAVPGKNWTLIRCIFWPCYHVWSAVAQNFH